MRYRLCAAHLVTLHRYVTLLQRHIVVGLCMCHLAILLQSTRRTGANDTDGCRVARNTRFISDTLPLILRCLLPIVDMTHSAGSILAVECPSVVIEGNISASNNIVTLGECRVTSYHIENRNSVSLASLGCSVFSSRISLFWDTVHHLDCCLGNPAPTYSAERYISPHTPSRL